MATVLGLDLGTNSIGWALVDDKKEKILGMGTRIFSEGVVNLGEGEGRETSKNASRTEARGARRQFYRRRLRKRYLLRKLAKNELCPLDYSSVKIWNRKEVFGDDRLLEWFKLNPYELRSKALAEEITLHEIGRIFYHMIQRRGFQSNSRSAGAENSQNSVIFKGDSKEGKIGISQTKEKIQLSKTLGSYLYELYPKDNQAYQNGLERIRNRYTTRQMYIDEFEAIWEHQKQYHPELTDKFKSELGGRKKDGYEQDGVLFHQRPLRSQKHLVGKCTLEPTKTKCPISAIPNEERRIYEWLNTLKYDKAGEPEQLTESERESIIKLLFSKEKVKFKAIRKVIDKTESYYQFNYKDDDNIYGSHTISNLSNKKFFGERWFELSEKEREDIWHVLYSFDDRDKLKQYALEKWRFTEEQADKISKFNLKDGYANLSRKAINNILPFLKQGNGYDIAVALGGIKNALGAKWYDYEQFLLDNVPEIVRSNIKGGYIKALKNVLKSECHVSDRQLTKLYHHSTSIKSNQVLERLPVSEEADKQILSIRNPIVTTALFEIRKVVNEITDLYGKPDQIKIELARDLKVSKSKRKEIRLEQKRLEKENNRVKDELAQLDQRPTSTNILKYKLWEECNKTCPYTGRNIEVNQLFSGAVQIEHIFPWSRSLNDSFMNKTLCFEDENRAKGNLTPFEFYSKQGESKWSEVKSRALSCFQNKPNYPNAYYKFKQFVKKKHDDDFISRQLNDTRYISKEAKNYLKIICDDVMVAPGQMTANLRHHWGLNTILDEVDSKTREDHRHHAIDALVMACSTRSHLQELSKWNRYDRSYELDNFPHPWDSFREDAETSVNRILVSHKKDKSILTVRMQSATKNGKKYRNLGVAARGQLHKEFVYGRRKAPNSQEAFHIRKPIDSITTEKQLQKLVDGTIRQLVYKRINALGGFKNGKIPEGTFFITDDQGAKIPQILLPNKKGNPVPVRKIRLKENIGGAEQLKDDQNNWVNPRNNHHVLIYKDYEGNLKEDVVTFWTVVERKRKGYPVYQLPPDGKEIVTTIQKNDMFLLELINEDLRWGEEDWTFLKSNLFRVEAVSSNYYEFRLHSNATKSKDINTGIYKRISSLGEGKNGWKTLNPLKVTVSVTGKIKIDNFQS